jgi:hypothetical protein
MRGMLTFGLVLLHDSSHPHTDARTRALLEHFNWELFDHPAYNPATSPREYHLKNWSLSQSFNNSEELMECVKTWPTSQAADFLDIDIKETYSPIRHMPQFRQ